MHCRAWSRLQLLELCAGQVLVPQCSWLVPNLARLYANNWGLTALCFRQRHVRTSPLQCTVMSLSPVFSSCPQQPLYPPLPSSFSSQNILKHLKLDFITYSLLCNMLDLQEVKRGDPWPQYWLFSCIHSTVIQWLKKRNWKVTMYCHIILLISNIKTHQFKAYGEQMI